MPKKRCKKVIFAKCGAMPKLKKIVNLSKNMSNINYLTNYKL